MTWILFGWVVGCQTATPPVAAAPEAAPSSPAVHSVDLPSGASPLIFAALPPGKGESGTPNHVNAAAVSFSPEPWAALPPGTVFAAIGNGGRVTLSYRGIEEGTYGCDGGQPVKWAVFDAVGDRPPEGPLLVFPLQAEGLRPLPIEVDGSPTRKERRWRIGADHHASIEESGPLQANFEVNLGMIPLSAPYETYTMDGAEPAKIDFTQASTVGMPAPVLALDAGTSAWIVTLAPTFEGFVYEWAHLGLKSSPVMSKQSLHYCAF